MNRASSENFSFNFEKLRKTAIIKIEGENMKVSPHPGREEEVAGLVEALKPHRARLRTILRLEALLGDSSLQTPILLSQGVRVVDVRKFLRALIRDLCREGAVCEAAQHHASLFLEKLKKKAP